MTNAPIIRIPVDLEAFKEFAAAFKVYADKVDQQPSDWQKVNQAIDKTGLGFAKTSEAIVQSLGSGRASAGALVDTLKSATKAQQDFQKAAARSDMSMESMFKKSAGVVKNFESLTRKTAGLGFKLASFAGFAELGGAGALLGLANVAGNVTQNAETAGGVGLDPGRYKAFTSGLSSVLPDGGARLLSSVASAQTDTQQFYKFAQMGLPLGKLLGEPSAQAAVDVFRQAVDTYKKNSNFALPQLQAALGFGLQQGDIKFAASEPDSQLKAQFAAALNPNAAASMGWNQQTTKNFQDLNTAVVGAKNKIEAAFINALAPLAPDFAQLATATTNLIPEFASFKKVLDPIYKFLNIKISVPTFSDITNARKEVIHAFKAAYGGATASVDNALRGTELGNLRGKALASAQNFASIEKAKGLPSGLLNSLATVESGWDPSAVSPKGAEGAFQLMPSTAAAMKVDAFNLGQSADAAGTIMAQNIAQFRDISKAIAAYNWGAGNVAADIKNHGKDWLKFAPKETQNEVANVLADMSPAAPGPSQLGPFRSPPHASDNSEKHLKTMVGLMKSLVSQGLVKAGDFSMPETSTRRIPIKAQMAAGGV